MFVINSACLYYTAVVVADWTLIVALGWACILTAVLVGANIFTSAFGAPGFCQIVVASSASLLAAPGNAVRRNHYARVFCSIFAGREAAIISGSMLVSCNRHDPRSPDSGELVPVTPLSTTKFIPSISNQNIQLWVLIPFSWSCRGNFLV